VGRERAVSTPSRPIQSVDTLETHHEWVAVELRHLRYFVAVAEELHVGRAAARLHMSQPPLSQQIRALERELGLQLFDRSRRRIRLTPAGAALLREARRALAEADRFQESAARLRSGRLGQLRVGFVGSALFSLVPEILQAFRREVPEAGLVLHESTSPELVDDVAKRRLDVAFVRPPVGSDAVRELLLAREPLVAALPASNPVAAAPEPLDIAALRAEDFVLFPRSIGPGYLDAVLRACHAGGFVPMATHSATQIHTLVGLVASGLGVSLVPEAVQGMQLPGVVYKPFAPPVHTIDLTLVWADVPPDPLVETFVDLAADAALATGRPDR